jgi:vacuolar-type H+-ATPase subunit F/Vma7
MNLEMWEEELKVLLVKQRCLKDLRERFARIKIQASPPIVPFRESAVTGVGEPRRAYRDLLLWWG